MSRDHYDPQEAMIDQLRRIADALESRNALADDHYFVAKAEHDKVVRERDEALTQLKIAVDHINFTTKSLKTLNGLVR